MSQEALDAVVSRIEARFPVGEPTVHSRSVTGEPYITFAIGGVKPEGEPDPIVSYGSWRDQSTEAEAVRVFEQSFEAYAADKTGTLYWRRKPELVPVEGGVAVRARFVITDKPVQENFKEAA